MPPDPVPVLADAANQPQRTAPEPPCSAAPHQEQHPSQRKKTVLVVEDHPIVRRGLIDIVDREPDLAVCGKAANAAEAIAEIERLQPNLVLLDMGLPDKSGLELLDELRALHPEIPVLMISMREETLFAERVIRAGGRGYVMKDAGPAAIVQAIHKVLHGGVYLSDRAADIVLDALCGSNSRSASESTSSLTDREFEIVRLIGQGLDSRAIAEKLGLSLVAVGLHRMHIKEKLRLADETELIQYALRKVRKHR